MNWNTSIRATDGYDSSNTTDWHYNLAIPELQELRPDFIQTHWDDAQNKIFMGTTPNDYLYMDQCPQYDAVDGEPEISGTATPTQVKELIVTSSALTEHKILLMMMFYRQIMGY